MREILFRGKLISGKGWSYGNLVVNTQGVTIITSDESFIGTFGLIDPKTVGQCTGLTDKNDKRIFEGDIIRYADMYDYNCYLESLDNTEVYDKCDFGDIWTVGEVVYGIEMGYPAFDLNKHDWDCNGLSELDGSGQYFYEVIGNIHDNPELLEGTK